MPRRLLERLGDNQTVIIDTRPADYFRGEKSDEARAGHIPGAVNRPFKADLGDGERLKPVEELAQAYGGLIASRRHAGDRPLPHRSSGQPDVFRADAAAWDTPT